MAEREYDSWLLGLQMLFRRDSEGVSLLELAARRMFDENVAHVFIDWYADGSDECVALLSDRGFVIRSQERAHTMMSFNVTSRIIATFSFHDTGDDALRQLVGYEVPPEVLRLYREQEVRSGKRVPVVVSCDEVANLAAYNRCAALQCARYVFAATHRHQLCVESHREP